MCNIYLLIYIQLTEHFTFIIEVPVTLCKRKQSRRTLFEKILIRFYVLIVWKNDCSVNLTEAVIQNIR